ncbi:hypothetical protein CH330_07650 [candidate division WOR-3 bacterium JGI_Cruoil_03_51_56]|uniref:LTD domain-containing protein n=1 Tax=candidate division WOR-3 bacterium JGI_Cruoil_03_51_56 TaxID=1973747 RepID=A0A235BRD7_UNCW3|nr:MAG: hypothetical protein CH330_07650 [candidate division WOR-3 bacterium JGI_Cruoil_03_51_56]
MKRVVLIVSFLLARTVGANPYVVTILNEFGYINDTLQWVELHTAPFLRDAVDLRGWRIVTSTSECTLDLILHEDDCVVITPQGLARGLNGHGTFCLRPDSDEIHLLPVDTTVLLWPFEEVVRYPRTPTSGRNAPGLSCPGSVALWNYDDYDGQSINWYVDSTPTPGEWNNDFSSVAGRIRGSGGEMADWATIRIAGTYGHCLKSISEETNYQVDGLGAGKYKVSAMAKIRGQIYYVTYPDSVEVGYSQIVSGIDIVIPVSGIAEPGNSLSGIRPLLRVAGELVKVACPGPADVDLELFDLSGRSTAELYRGRFECGEHRFELPGCIRPGVYFVRLKAETAEATAKIVVKR